MLTINSFLNPDLFIFFLTCTKICIFFTRQLARFFGLNISACPQHSIMHRYVSEQSIMSLAISSGKGMKIDYVIGLVSLSEIIYYNSSLH